MKYWIVIKKIFFGAIHIIYISVKSTWNFFKKIPRAFGLMTITEKIILFIALITLIVLLTIKGNQIYLYSTKTQPIVGGKITFGRTDIPKTLNPIFVQTDSEREIVNLVFSPLIRVKPDGKIENVLIKSWRSDKEQKQFTIVLSDTIKWHDSEPIIADDVIYTFSILQSPIYNGLYKNSFDGVEIERVDDKTVNFILPASYPGFMKNLDVRILPSHLLQEKPLADLPNDIYSFKPIGNGPYRIQKSNLTKNNPNIILERVKNSSCSAKIKIIEFKYYENFSQVYTDFKDQKINSLEEIDENFVTQVQKDKNTQVIKNSSASYNILHLNLNNEFLQKEYIRSAIYLATNRKPIINDVYFGQAKEATGPVTSGLFGYRPLTNDFNVKKARQKLIDNGWKDTNGDGYFEKNGVRLEFKLIAPETANFQKIIGILKSQYKQIGIKINSNMVSPKILQDEFLKKRKYDILLIGETLGNDFDIYPYWYSSQISNTGFNFSNFNNSDVDKLLDDIRATDDDNIKKEKLIKIQEIIFNQVPAIFLTEPVYNFAISKTVKNVKPTVLSDQAGIFENVCDWYINLGRGKK